MSVLLDAAYILLRGRRIALRMWERQKKASSSLLPVLQRPALVVVDARRFFSFFLFCIIYRWMHEATPVFRAAVARLIRHFTLRCPDEEAMKSLIKVF